MTFPGGSPSTYAGGSNSAIKAVPAPEKPAVGPLLEGSVGRVGIATPQTAYRKSSPNISDCAESSATPYVPCCGQLFASHDEARDAYMEYAGRVGFKVRMGSTKIVDGVLLFRRMLCSKQGHPKPVASSSTSDMPKKRRIRNVRCGCPAMMYVALDSKTQRWRVASFVEEHNHALDIPSKRRNLPVNRVISPMTRGLFHSLSSSNISPSNQYYIDSLETSEFDSLPSTSSAFLNVHRDQRLPVSCRDADLIIDRFKELRCADPNFYYSFTKHDDGSLCNLFWADPSSISDYSIFGDALTFDTIYQTNMNNLVLCLFCGVNHHKNTIIFAAGFLFHENVESFVWLFEEFLKCMGEPPRTIITKHDPAITNALLKVMPTTFHRLCKWHITRKMGDKIGTVYQDQAAMSKFHDFLNNSEDVVKFEEAWAAWIADNRLEQNQWLADIFSIRHKWCPIYMMEYFFAGMSTTQCRNGMNRIVKRQMKSHYILLEFLAKYENLLAALRKKENMLDHNDRFPPHKNLTPLVIENFVKEMYTNEAFLDFQEQAVKSLHYVIKKMDRVEVGDIEVFSIRTFEVEGVIHVDPSIGGPQCSCNLFRSIGIPCRHLICYLTNNEISKLPTSLICERWFSSTKRKNALVPSDKRASTHSSLHKLCNDLLSLAEAEDKQLNLHYVENLLKKGIETLTKERVNVVTPSRIQSMTRFDCPSTEPLLFRNQKVVKMIGSNQGGSSPKHSERFVSKTEQMTPRVRSCSVCGNNGHNKRSCPAVIAPSTVPQPVEEVAVPSLVP